MLIETTLSLVLGFILLFLSYLYFQRRPRNYPPGPLGLPLLGHLLMMGKTPFKAFIKWKKIYGPVISIDFGSFPAIVISDYKILKEMLKNMDFLGRPDLQPFLDRSGGARKGIIFSDGSIWQEQRRFTIKHLKEFGFIGKKLEPIILFEIQEMIESLKAKKSKPIATNTLFNPFILNQFWKIIANDRFVDDDHELADILERISKNIEEHNNVSDIAMFFPWISKNFRKLSGYEDNMKDLEPMLNFISSRIKIHRESYIEGHPRDLIDAYDDQIKQTTTDQNSSFYKDEGEMNLRTVILDLFLAGNETISTTLRWAMVFLSLNDNIQEKLHNEIVREVGRSHPSLELRPNMPYTEAFIWELYRYSSVIPIGIFKKTTKNVKLQEWEIPKDTMIITNLYDAHFDEEFWGDPQNFRPERFLSEDEKTFIPKSDAFFPFLTGKRVCIGESIARDSTFLYIVAIVQNFIVKSDKENPTSYEQQFSIVITPAPHKISFNERI